MEEEYKSLCNELIAYCQRQGVLSTESESLFEELENITGIDQECLKELID